jgi:putative addiction module killer protein
MRSASVWIAEQRLLAGQSWSRNRKTCKNVSSWIHKGLVNTFIRSSDFDAWLSRLADQRAKARILARLRSAALGNFGDCESVGDGVLEMRIHFGPGYRLYFVRTGTIVYIVLGGGDKSSQKKDIARAKKMARELEKKP